ncbi:MAG TPA: M23 family metallopeptidase [Actinomycetota bacterium]|nr:M23 family metallopeptidase [Actinomycetota bacterium]
MTGLFIIVAAALVVAPLGDFAPAARTPAQQPPPASSGRYSWPVRGPVIQEFEAPAGPYGPGHRGIDIGAAFGSPVVAAQDGVVAFSGWIAGALFVSIDHPDGIRTTYSWLSDVKVRKGDTLNKGETIGRSGAGHPGEASPHLHFGARVGDIYIDPLLLLEEGSVVGLIHLAPLEPA